MPKLRPLTLHGECIDVSYEGKGVLKTPKGIVFVDGVLPQEEADIDLFYSRNGALFGKIKKITKPSQYRIPSECRVFLKCGGCAFQNLLYPQELELKRILVADQLYKVGGIKQEVLLTQGMPNPRGYRNKVQLPLGKENGHAVAGFYQENTHRLIPMAECLLEDRKAHSIVQDCLALMDKYHIEPYEEDTGRGDIRHLFVRTSLHYDETMLCLVCKNRSFHNRSDLISELRKKHPEITTIVQNTNPRKTNVILGERTDILFGPGSIRESLLGIEFKISAKSFFQTNVLMAEMLFSYVLEQAGIQETDIVYDAYSGIGTIGLIASKKASFVRAVEIEASSVKDAIRTKRRNNIPNFQIFQGDATEDIIENAKAGNKFDVLIMDPPRKGSTLEFLKAVKTLGPRTIIYVSCNPGTLARDLKELVPAYHIDSVKPFDMFPRTNHVETVCVLSRGNQIK